MKDMNDWYNEADRGAKIVWNMVLWPVTLIGVIPFTLPLVIVSWVHRRLWGETE